MAKIFVGSIPTDTPEDWIRAEFEKYGYVTNFYFRHDPSGLQRSWAFVTFAQPHEAASAIEATSGGKLFLAGALNPCEVGYAKSTAVALTSTATASGSRPAKVFVGSIPVGTTEGVLRSEFERFGLVTEIFMKVEGTSGRMWAFVTFADTSCAMAAISSTHETLMFPGAVQPCNVSLAKGVLPLHFDEPLATFSPSAPSRAPAPQAPLPPPGSPVKLFVGSIPEGTSKEMVIEEFSKYGAVTNAYLKDDASEPGRMWAFVTFSDMTAAHTAIQCCHEQLVFPGSVKPCNVKLARQAGSSFTVCLREVDAETKALVATPGAFTTTGVQTGPTKLFVGSIPSGTTEDMLKYEFEKFGPVAEIFLKIDVAEAGKQWAFVTMVTPESAAAAGEALHEQFVFPSAEKGLTVSFARNSDAGGSANAALVAAQGAGCTKLFVGSIPAGTTQEQLWEEFSRFGSVLDIFLRLDKGEDGRLWAFVSFDNSNSAAAAVAQLHERLVFPGASRPCAVSFAKNSQATHSAATATLAAGGHKGPVKLFVGTIPMGTPEFVIRSEFEKFGQVTDVFLKDEANADRMWGFVTLTDARAAAQAVSSCHEKLMLPGSLRPIAVSFAKDGKSGGQPTPTSKGRGKGLPPAPAQPVLARAPPGQPPPPPGLPPAAAQWKVYYTTTGLPYYHNASLNKTQWEVPLELDPGGTGGLAPPPAPAQRCRHFSPY